MTEIQTNTCYRHPNRETSLRCNRCEKYICAQCAVRTPTGYRCPECIREQKRIYNTAKPQDYVFAFLTASVLTLISTLLVQLIGGFFGFFYILIIFAISTGAGSLIAEAVRRVVQKRRSKPLFITATAGAVAGGLLAVGNTLLIFFLTLNVSYLGGLLWPGIFIFLVASTVYVRLSGIQLNR